MTVLYFTATGNGLYIAKRIGGTLVSIPKAVKETCFHFKDDKIGIVFPVYGWAVPGYIREFLKKVKLESDYIFSVMSYGMSAGAASDHLLTITAENGIHFSYINTIKMIDNYVPVFKVEDQKESESKKQIEANLKEIVDHVHGGRQWIPKNSFISKLMSRVLLRVDRFKKGAGVTDQFHIEDTCTKCGTCAKVCPTDNITADSAPPVFAHNCISCLSCTHNCPQNAIRLSSEKSRTRFRNPNVSLKEIIEANGK
jgi:ferredoxin